MIGKPYMYSRELLIHIESMVWKGYEWWVVLGISHPGEK